MATTIVYLVRHGDVDSRGIFRGRLPGFLLNAEGKMQAEKAAEFLKDKPLAAIFSSPMLRARETAEVIALHHPGLSILETELLHEVYSPYDGRPIGEVQKTKWHIFKDIPLKYDQAADVVSRALNFLRMVDETYPGQEVAATSHGDLLFGLHLWIAGEPFTDDARDEFDHLEPDYASILTVRIVDGKVMPNADYHVPYKDN